MKYLRSLQDHRQQYILGDEPINIGRSPQNTIILGESTISRFHARIEQRGQQVLIVDLNSMGGTYVNGNRIRKEHPLAHGDKITIGSTQWQFYIEPSMAPQAARQVAKDGYAFISYSRADSKIIDILIKRLNEAGYRVWVDRVGIGGGEHWRQEIVDAIKNCTVFILALSSNSVRSDNVRKELDLADSAKCPIVPIELQQITDLPAKFQYQLAGIQRINLATNFEGGFGQLLNAIDSGVTPTYAPWSPSLGSATDTVKAPRKKMNPWLKLFIWIVAIFLCYAFLSLFISSLFGY
jgi:hypothetical protein